MSPLNLPASETLSVEHADCTLTVTLAFPQPDSLQVQYRVRNTSSLALYLLNQLWENGRRDAATGEYRLEVLPDLVNIEVQPTVIKVSKEIVDVPYGLLVEVPHMPGLMRLASGAEYTQVLNLPLPLRPYTIYESDKPTGHVITRPLQFELGYITGLPHVEDALHQSTTTSGTSIYSTRHFPAKHQSVIGVGPFQVPVQSYTQLHPYPPKPAASAGWTPWG